MEILIISRCLPWPLHYGDRVLLHHTLTALTARGHACDVIAFGGHGDTTDAIERSAGLCRDLEVIPERPRAAWRYLTRLARPFPTSAAEAWSPGMWQAVERRLQSRRYDIVHLFGGIQIYELRELVQKRPAIIVPYESFSLLLERTIEDTVGLFGSMRVRVELAMARRYERVMYRGYDRVVVLTAHDRDALLNLAPGLPVVAIANGVPSSDAVVRAPVETPEIVFVGNFEYAPNVRAATMLVREVLPRISRCRPDVRLVLVGANPPPAVRTLTAGNVEVTGRVPEIGPYLVRAWCSVAPITRGAGIKTKILEAMAAAVPVVTTPLGCEGLDVVDGVHLLVGSSAQELSDATLALLNDRSLAERIGAAGRAFVQANHTWSGVARHYEQLYADVIAERSPGGY